MTRLRPLAALLGLAAVALVAVLGRYEVVGVGTVAVARLDRWTGRTLLCLPRVGCFGMKMSPVTYTVTMNDGTTRRIDFDHDPVRVELNDAIAQLPRAAPAPVRSDADLDNAAAQLVATDLDALSDEELLKRLIPLGPEQP